MPTHTKRKLGLWFVLSTIPFLGFGCQQKQSQTQNEAASDLLSEDYQYARGQFKTRLVREEPAPQQGERLVAPKGVSEVTYSPKLKLKAWVSSAPTGTNKNKQQSAVLFLHGGFAAGIEDWEMAKPYRDAGFVVMMPILRGENGQAGSYSMFYNEVTDVLAAAEALAALPYVDNSHIFVAGHSVGGTLTQLASMSTRRFRGAASFSGSPNQFIWSKDQPELIPFDPKDDLEMEMRSPRAFPSSFKCPLRMYYGDTEVWCDKTSQTTATLAQKKGLDVRAVRIPGDHFSAVPAAMQKSIKFFRSL